MGGCNIKHEDKGDRSAGKWEVITFALIGGAGFAALLGVAYGLGGAIASGFIAYPFWRATRLVEHTHTYTIRSTDVQVEKYVREIVMAGCVLCAGRNVGGIMADGDWTFNLGGPSLTLVHPNEPMLHTDSILTDDSRRGDPAFRTVDESGEVALHSEISSHAGSFGAWGGAIGAAVGLAAGVAAGMAACAALTAGLCLIAAALLAAAGASVGGVAGREVGKAIGKGVDELADTGEEAQSVSKGCAMKFIGRWVTDTGHQWNEIHDVKQAKKIECLDCHEDETDPVKVKQTIAAVDTGRHPSGEDP